MLCTECALLLLHPPEGLPDLIVYLVELSRYVFFGLGIWGFELHLGQLVHGVSGTIPNLRRPCQHLRDN